MAMDLSGKVLVVTGADGALGQSVAATLSAYGAKLALLSHAGTSAGKQPSGARQYGGVGLTLETAARSAKQPVAPNAGGIEGFGNISRGVCWGKIETHTIQKLDGQYKN